MLADIDNVHATGDQHGVVADVAMACIEPRRSVRLHTHDLNGRDRLADLMDSCQA